MVARDPEGEERAKGGFIDFLNFNPNARVACKPGRPGVNHALLDA